ncbi:hypothetical protein KIN20_014289 [Parelaphostrongylus tenuis]|uniref:Uncharacterized protein n=1 Tax=Parelaphostrongylus tenuis TaxID=148309 RepID=A0AAD5QP73_PARTN|nr:hypothetical protein KIN20_014289 [Parelaphostrongylus tenuis]
MSRGFCSPSDGFFHGNIFKLILDVLEQLWRAACLPDFLITTILKQLGIKALHTPLSYLVVSVAPMMMVDNKFSTMQLIAFMRHTDMMMACVIHGKTVTTTCLSMAATAEAAGAVAGNMFMLSMPMHFTPIPLQHLSISGTLAIYLQPHHRNLEQGDVVKCSEQSASNDNIGSIWNALRHGSCHRHLKREFIRRCFRTNYPLV